MKKMTALFVISVIIAWAATLVYASDYQGVEKQDSIFQKLGDLITGKYEVKKGESLKKVGVVQVMADQVKEIKSGPVR